MVRGHSAVLVCHGKLYKLENYFIHNSLEGLTALKRYIMRSLGLLALILLTTMVMSEPHHHNDPYTPVIHLLKQIRKARKHGGSFSREGEDGNYASASQSSGSFTFPSSSQDNTRIQINIPNAPPPGPIPTSSPADIQRINGGVSTILRGVGTLNLEDILRGSFMFTRNENVRSVANNVISSIFGNPAGGGGGGGGGDGNRQSPGRN